jgi:hypothetical protein
MSPIALPIAQLKPALTGFAKVINRRPALPVRNHIKIERSKDGWVALSVTHLDQYVTCPKSDTLLIRADATEVIIQYAIGAEVAESKVDSLSAVEFPEIPRIPFRTKGVGVRPLIPF